MFWEKNVKPLLKNPAFAVEFSQLEATSVDGLDWMAVETSSGLSLVVDGVPFHSLDGAIPEAEHIIATCVTPGKSNIHLIFGLGFGYLAEAALAASDGFVVVFEPNWPLLKFLLTEADFAHLFNHPRFQLCASGDQLAYTLKHILEMHGNVDGRLDGIISPGAAALLSKDCVDEVTHIVEQVLGQQHSYFRMGLLLNPSWQVFALNNTVHLNKTEPMLALKNAHLDKPAVILSAGPSLEYYLHDVMYWKDRIITIAVPQALHVLQKAGLSPDYVAVLDYEGLEHQLSGIDTSKVRFLNGPFAHPLAFTSPAKGHYLVNFVNYGNLADWYDQATGVKNLAIASGGTVSLMAVGLAQLMGCNPITLLGQDLAFRGTQQYAGNVHVQLQGDHFARDESHISKAMRLKVVDIPGQQGEILKTSPDYLMFRDQFADMAKELTTVFPNLRLYNASIGGADIPGFMVKALADLAEMESWSDKPLVPKTIQSGAYFSNAGFIPDLEQLTTQITQTIALSGLLLGELGRWSKAIRNRGATAERGAKLDNAQGDFVEALQANWLIYGYLGQEIWDWKKLFTESPVSFERVTSEIRLVEQMRHLLQMQLLPAVSQTLQTLQMQNLVSR